MIDLVKHGCDQYRYTAACPHKNAGNMQNGSSLAESWSGRHGMCGACVNESEV